MVLEVGLEPTRLILANGFLELNVSAALTLTTGYPTSPLRLPIPPFEHIPVVWICRREEADYSVTRLPGVIQQFLRPLCPVSSYFLPDLHREDFYIKPKLEVSKK